MISLNDYLYSGNTVLKILHNYSDDLCASAVTQHNNVDLMHSNILLQEIELLEHNDFLTSQSHRIKEFYKYMVQKFPFLAFTFKGRIKSLIRLEEKINDKIVDFIYGYYMKNGSFPAETEIKEHIRKIRDLIAYRIVISLPQCHLKEGDNKEERELAILYEIANELPSFLAERGFDAEISSISGQEMDDYAEIGPANHLGYEKRQEKERSRRSEIPAGKNIYFDNSFERGMLLQNLDLSKVCVNMFTAFDNQLINDGCGLFRGRLILPFEHLSRFQNDLID